jgi:hypothetical protein
MNSRRLIGRPWTEAYTLSHGWTGMMLCINFGRRMFANGWSGRAYARPAIEAGIVRPKSTANIEAAA